MTDHPLVLLRGFGWLAQAVSPVLLGFWSAVAMGLGALGSWLGGRSRSKQHERQLSSEDRRHEASLRDRREERATRRALMEEYWRQEAVRRAAYEQATAQAIGALLPGTGIALDPRMLAQLGASGRGRPMPGPQGMGDYQNLPVVSAGVPGGGGGNWDWTAQIPQILQDKSKAPWQTSAGELPENAPAPVLHRGQANWFPNRPALARG